MELRSGGWALFLAGNQMLTEGSEDGYHRGWGITKEGYHGGWGSYWRVVLCVCCSPHSSRPWAGSYCRAPPPSPPPRPQTPLLVIPYHEPHSHTNTSILRCILSHTLTLSHSHTHTHTRRRTHAQARTLTQVTEAGEKLKRKKLEPRWSQCFIIFFASISRQESLMSNLSFLCLPLCLHRLLDYLRSTATRDYQRKLLPVKSILPLINKIHYTHITQDFKCFFCMH